MRILRDPALADRIENLDIQNLCEEWFLGICGDEPYDPDLHGFVCIVEVGDSIEVIERESECSLLRDPISGCRYGESDFRPCFETLEEHPSCYEMIFIAGDGDYGINILIPKAVGINTDLLHCCTTYAVPAPELEG